MTRATVDAGQWFGPEHPEPPPVQYVVEVEGGRVHLVVLHGVRNEHRQITAHAMALQPNEARSLGRTLMLAGMEAG